MLNALFVLFAQEKAPEDADKQAPTGLDALIRNPILLFVLLGVMYLVMVVLPQGRRDKKQRAELLANLKKNDEVVTAAGIIGVVTNIKDGADEVTLKIDDNAKIRVLRSTIIKIIPRESAPGA